MTSLPMPMNFETWSDPPTLLESVLKSAVRREWDVAQRSADKRTIVEIGQTASAQFDKSPKKTGRKLPEKKGRARAVTAEGEQTDGPRSWQLVPK
jgi:hypothetical protein